MKTVSAVAFVVVQHLLPRTALTAAVYRLARVRTKAVKNLLIRVFVRLFRVNTAEVRRSVPDGFACLNDFFVRELASDARPVDTAKNSIVSPVDGIVSACGNIDRHRLYQAKGRSYSLQTLLATDLADADAYQDGTFATLYLAPYHYHRVHAPWSGRITAARYVPGDLFSVNEKTVSRIRKLFVRNERLILHFVTDSGPMALILVGALNVGSISTPWSGEIRPRRHGVVEELDWRRSGSSLVVAKGELLGWFNMGSTVLMLMPPVACELRPELKKGDEVVMGRPLATLSSLAP